MDDATSPMSLTVLPDGQEVIFLLSDGRSMSRLARTSFDLASLEVVSRAAISGSASAALALWSALFPGSVGELINRSAPRALVLRLPLSFDALAWELAESNGVPIAARWSISRQMLFDEEAIGVAPSPTSDADLLRVLCVGNDLGAAVGRRSESRVVLQRLSSTQWTLAGVLGSIAANDVVLLDADSAQRLPALWPAIAAHRAPPLVILCGVGPDIRVSCARELGRRGSAMLCVDDSPSLFDELLEQLLAGRSVADSVRQLRSDPAGSGAERRLLLYGPAAAALCVKKAPAALSGSLRQVTTLSFDLVDSTVLLQRLGEERYSELLEKFHAECGAVVHRHGGMADDPQGDDGIMSYFGYPEADENAAEHAVAAGLEIAQAVRRLEVEVRVGIATGRVAVRGGQPVGVSIHLAARLQVAAAPGSVLVAESTRVLLGKRFELAPLEQPLALKGIVGSSAAYRVSGRAERNRADSTDVGPRLTPLVGREAEMAVLIEQWDRALQGDVRLVRVIGEAGMGKSRLIAEFRRWLTRRGQPSLECRGHADTRDSAFVALSDTLRRLLQLQAQDDGQTQRLKIERALPPGMPADEAVPLIAALLSVQGSAAGSPSDNAPQQRERTLVLLLDWLRLALRAQPVCLVVEDAHWLDPSTREFLTRLLAEPKGLPLLVLVTQRSDGDGNWRPLLVHETVELRGLSPVASRWLARQACGDRRLPLDVLRLLAKRSDGVPLFLEESVQMALESGVGFTESLRPLRLNVPTTLQGLLMARLDRLSGARPVAQFGAALGREFPEQLLRAVLSHGGVQAQVQDLPDRLHELERAGLLLRTGDAAWPCWAFKHALVRDIAYQSMWERDRQRVHRHVAEVLATQFAALVERQPELLARHQTEAGLDALALAQWELAARSAAATSAHEEAISHIDSALLLLQRQPPGHDRDRTELRLQLLLASRYIATEGYGADRVERIYGRAADLCQVLGDEAALLKVELGRHGWHFMRGDLSRAHEIAVRSEAMAGRSPDAIQRMQASWALAITQFHLGDSLPAVQRMDRCLATYRAEMHRPGAVQDPGVMCLCYSAWAQWELGHADDALRRVQRVIALAHELDHKFSLGEAYGFATSVHLFRGEIDAALDYAQRSIAICEEGGFAVWLAHALVMRGRLRCDLGQFDAGLLDIDEGFSMWMGTGAVVTLPMYMTLKAEGLALAGRPGEGLTVLTQALALIERTGERYHEAEVRRLSGELRWQQAALTGGSGATAANEAEAWLRGAHALAQQQHKHSFALRAAVGLARLWLAQGKALQAGTLLESTLSGMPESGDTRDVVSARLMMRRTLEEQSMCEGGVQ